MSERKTVIDGDLVFNPGDVVHNDENIVLQVGRASSTNTTLVIDKAALTDIQNVYEENLTKLNKKIVDTKTEIDTKVGDELIKQNQSVETKLTQSKDYILEEAKKLIEANKGQVDSDVVDSKNEAIQEANKHTTEQITNLQTTINNNITTINTELTKKIDDNRAQVEFNLDAIHKLRMEMAANNEGKLQFLGKLDETSEVIEKKTDRDTWLTAQALSKGFTSVIEGMFFGTKDDVSYWYQGGTWYLRSTSAVQTASNTSFGVVKGSDADLKVSVDANGEMSVNKLEDKLNDINTKYAEADTKLKEELNKNIETATNTAITVSKAHTDAEITKVTALIPIDTDLDAKYVKNHVDKTIDGKTVITEAYFQANKTITNNGNIRIVGEKNESATITFGKEDGTETYLTIGKKETLENSNIVFESQLTNEFKFNKPVGQDVYQKVTGETHFVPYKQMEETINSLNTRLTFLDYLKGGNEATDTFAIVPSKDKKMTLHFSHSAVGKNAIFDLDLEGKSALTGLKDAKEDTDALPLKQAKGLFFKLGEDNVATGNNTFRGKSTFEEEILLKNNFLRFHVDNDSTTSMGYDYDALTKNDKVVTIFNARQYGVPLMSIENHHHVQGLYLKTAMNGVYEIQNITPAERPTQPLRLDQAQDMVKGFIKASDDITFTGEVNFQTKNSEINIDSLNGAHFNFTDSKTKSNFRIGRATTWNNNTDGYILNEDGDIHISAERTKANEESNIFLTADRVVVESGKVMFDSPDNVVKVSGSENKNITVKLSNTEVGDASRVILDLESKPGSLINVPNATENHHPVNKAQLDEEVKKLSDGLSSIDFTPVNNKIGDLDQLKTTVKDSLVNSINSLKEETEAKISLIPGERDKAIEAAIAKSEEELTAGFQYDILESHQSAVDKSKSYTNLMVGQLNTHVNSNIAKNTTAISQFTTDVDEALKAFQTNMSNDKREYITKIGELDSKIDANASNATQEVKTLETTMNKHFQDLKGVVDSNKDEINNKVDPLTTKVGTIETNLTALTGTVTKNKEDQDKILGSAQSYTDEAIKKVNAVNGNFAGELTKLEQKVNANKTQIDNDLQSTYTHLDAEIKNVDSKLTNVNTTLTTTLNSLSETTTKQLTEFSNHYKQHLTDSKNALDTVKTEVEGKITTIEGKVTTLDGKLDTFQDETLKKFQNSHNYYEQKFTDAETNLNNQVTLLDGKITTAKSELENANTVLTQRVETFEQTVNKNFEDLNTHYTQHIKDSEGKLTTAVHNLEAKIGENTTKIASSLQEAKSYTDTKVSEAKTELTASITDLGTKVTANETAIGNLRSDFDLANKGSIQLAAIVTKSSTEIENMGDTDKVTFLNEEIKKNGYNTPKTGLFVSTGDDKSYWFINKNWYLRDSANVNIATNDKVGIVKGKAQDGYSTIDADGSMKLQGYDALVAKDSELEQKHTTLVGRVTTNETEIASIKTDLKGAKETIVKNTTDIATNKTNIEELTKKANNLETNQNSHANRISVNEGKLATIEKQIPLAGEQIKKNVEEIAKNKANIATLGGRLNDVESFKSTIEGKVNANTASINTLNTDVSSIKTQSETNKNNISSIQTDLNNLTGKVTGLETSQSTLSGKVTANEVLSKKNETELATLKTKVSTAETKLNNVSAKANANEQEITKLKSSITANDNAITVIQEEMKELTKNTDANTSNITKVYNALKPQIEDNTNKITASEGKIDSNTKEIEKLRGQLGATVAGDLVTLKTDQTIDGEKTFSKPIKIGEGFTTITTKGTPSGLKIENTKDSTYLQLGVTDTKYSNTYKIESDAEYLEIANVDTKNPVTKRVMQFVTNTFNISTGKIGLNTFNIDKTIEITNSVPGTDFVNLKFTRVQIDSQNQVLLINNPEPTQDNHLATKKYVDDRIFTTVEGPLEFTNKTLKLKANLEHFTIGKDGLALDPSKGIIKELKDKDTELKNAIDTKANASEVVKLSGTQTINGDKTFSSPVTVGDATADGHAVNKKVLNSAMSNVAKLDASNTFTANNTFKTNANDTILSIIPGADNKTATVTLKNSGSQEVLKMFKEPSNDKTKIQSLRDDLDISAPDNKSLTMSAFNVSITAKTSGTLSLHGKVAMDTDLSMGKGANQAVIHPDAGVKSLKFSTTGSTNSYFNLDLENRSGLTGIKDPTNDRDATPKKWVEDKIAAAAPNITVSAPIVRTGNNLSLDVKQDGGLKVEANELTVDMANGPIKTALDGKANANEVVKTTTNQDVRGVKTFKDNLKIENNVMFTTTNSKIEVTGAPDYVMRVNLDSNTGTKTIAPIKIHAAGHKGGIDILTTTKGDSVENFKLWAADRKLEIKGLKKTNEDDTPIPYDQFKEEAIRKNVENVYENGQDPILRTKGDRTLRIRGTKDKAFYVEFDRYITGTNNQDTVERYAYMGRTSNQNTNFTIESAVTSGNFILKSATDMELRTGSNKQIRLYGKVAVQDGYLELGSSLRLGRGSQLVTIAPEDDSEKELKFSDGSIGSNNKFKINLENKVKLYNLPDPVQDRDAVYKKWVEDKIATVGGNNLAKLNVSNTFTANQNFVTANDTTIMKLKPGANNKLAYYYITNTAEQAIMYLGKKNTGRDEIELEAVRDDLWIKAPKADKGIYLESKVVEVKADETKIPKKVSFGVDIRLGVGGGPRIAPDQGNKTLYFGQGDSNKFDIDLENRTRIMNLKDPQADRDAVPKTWVNNNAVMKTGNQDINGEKVFKGKVYFDTETIYRSETGMEITNLPNYMLRLNLDNINKTGVCSLLRVHYAGVRGGIDVYCDHANRTNKLSTMKLWTGDRVLEVFGLKTATRDDAAIPYDQFKNEGIRKNAENVVADNNQAPIIKSNNGGRTLLVRSDSDKPGFIEFEERNGNTSTSLAVIGRSSGSNKDILIQNYGSGWLKFISTNEIELQAGNNKAIRFKNKLEINNGGIQVDNGNVVVSNGYLEVKNNLRMGRGGGDAMICPEDNSTKQLKFTNSSVGANCMFNINLENKVKLYGLKEATTDDEAANLSNVKKQVQAGITAHKSVFPTFLPKGTVVKPGQNIQDGQIVFVC